MNLEETIKRILMEESRPLKIMRRSHLIDDELKRLMNDIYKPNKICIYTSGEELVNVIIEATIDAMYWTYFGNMDDNSNEWSSIYHYMVNYLEDKYSKELLTYYDNNCNSNKIETNESELTEKCWPGYTQKGMKTMFGKRYPNCVKKTKK